MLIFVVVLSSVVLLGGVGLFVAFSILKPILRMTKMAVAQNALAPRTVHGTPAQEAEWLQLRKDAAASAGPLTPAGAAEIRAALADLEAADPAFEPESFLQRAEMAYLLIKRALFLCDPAPLGAFVAPSLYAYTVDEVEKMKASGMRARCDDLVVDRAFAQKVERDAAGDRIWVHFDVTGRTRYVDATTGAVRADSGAGFSFGEQCLFQRDRGVTTVLSGGVFAQKCPACGAPLELSLDARCDHCGAEVANGTHDWTLAAAVFVPYAGKTVDVLGAPEMLDPTAGLEAIRTSDPAFSFEALSARVAAVFGELEAALCTGNLDGARAFLSPGLYLGWSMQAEQMRAAGLENVVSGLELSGMHPVAVRHGAAFDDVTMRIEGKRARYVRDARGERFSGDTAPAAFAEDWTFQRSAAAKTSSRAGILEKHCPNCGAPLAVNAIGECGYCHVAVTSGTFDWVLSRITRADVPAETGRSTGFRA